MKVIPKRSRSALAALYFTSKRVFSSSALSIRPHSKKRRSPRNLESVGGIKPLYSLNGFLPLRFCLASSYAHLNKLDISSGK